MFRISPLFYRLALLNLLSSHVIQVWGRGERFLVSSRAFYPLLARFNFFAFNLIGPLIFSLKHILR